MNCYIIGHVNALIVDPGSPHGRSSQRLRESTVAPAWVGGHSRRGISDPPSPGPCRRRYDDRIEFDLPVAAHLHTLATLRAQLAAHGRVRPSCCRWARRTASKWTTGDGFRSCTLRGIRPGIAAYSSQWARFLCVAT